jgi:tetratricopeptide (TPR) repeat protein
MWGGARYLLVGFLGLLASTAATAGPVEDASADALYQRAEQHFSVAEIGRALAAFQQAYRLKPIPRHLFSIGECHRYLGQDQAAIASFRHYLRHLPRARNRAQVEKLIEELTGKLARSASRPASTETVVHPAPPPREVPPSTPGEERRQGTGRALFWTGAALTGALLVVGVVTGQLAHERGGEYRDPATAVAERQALKDSGERLRTVSIVSFAVAGAAAIGTAVVGILGWRRARAERAAVRVMPGAGGLALSGEF